jgi:biotin carboxyl carrier protein
MTGGPELTPQDVHEILRLVDESRFDEFELETPTFSVRFRRGGGEERASARVESTEGAAAADGLLEIVSPMVGTFYRSPAPDAPPFVTEGATVQRDSPVCIVEVMKLMNRVVAGVSGVVVEVCRRDGESVQYGDVLFRVRAA